MFYCYQDRQTLCVTLEDPGKEPISESALRAIIIFPLFPLAFLMTLFGFLFTLLYGYIAGAPLLLPHAPLMLATLPFVCAGFAALVVIYMKLRASAWEGEYGYANAAIDSIPVATLFTLLFLIGGMNTFAITFGTILLWSLTFIAYIISFEYIKKPSHFQMWMARCFIIPGFFFAAMSVYVVLSGGRWATLLVTPMCVLLVLSTMLLAVELSVQAYKGREVPVWRYKASDMMGGAILLMYLAHIFFDLLPLLFK